MPTTRSYVVTRTQETRIFSAESPAHAVALAEEVFQSEGDLVDTKGHPVNAKVRTTDVTAREDI